MNKPKIIVVVGPTASGKTSLSIELAKRFDGEVISADSRQVYKGLDIGSAKVTEDEMEGVPHHLLDVAGPKEVYTAADFKRDAGQAVDDILSRGKVPIIAGGTFFYVDVLLGRVSLPEVPPNEELRVELETKSTEELFAMLKTLDPKRAGNIEKDNPRRLIRAIEIAKALGHVPPPEETECPYEVLTIGLEVDMNVHGETVKKRLVERLEMGMLEEVKVLLALGVTHERLESFGLEYRYLSRYLQGSMEYDAMVDELSIKIRQFAKRQMSWLKRDNTIKWFRRDDDTVPDLVRDFLST